MKVTHTFEIITDTLKIDIAANVKHSNSQWLLCLHGIQSNKALFDELFEHPLASNFSVIALDLVGFGRSSKPKDFSYDIQDQAKMIVEMARMLDMQRLHIIGHSLGGMIGTLLLNPLKNIVHSFINLEGNLTLSDCGLSREVSECSFPLFQSHTFKDIKHNLRHSPEPGSADRTRWLDEIPDFAFYKTCQSIVQWSATNKLLQLFTDACCRKLFIYGSDTGTKADCLPKAIARLKIPNAGHFMLQDNPTACYKAMQDFLLITDS